MGEPAPEEFVFVDAPRGDPCLHGDCRSFILWDDINAQSIIEQCRADFAGNTGENHFLQCGQSLLCDDGRFYGRNVPRFLVELPPQESGYVRITVEVGTGVLRACGDAVPPESCCRRCCRYLAFRDAQSSRTSRSKRPELFEGSKPELPLRVSCPEI